MGFIDRLKAFVLPSGSGRGSTFWSWADAGMSMSGSGHLRRPLWLPRSYKPAAEAYYLK